MPVEASKQKQVFLHVATDLELFGCRTSVELLVVSEARCLEYSCCCKLIFSLNDVFPVTINCSYHGQLGAKTSDHYLE